MTLESGVDIARRVRNLDLTFHWLGASDEFWYRRETRQGQEVILVNASTGIQTVLADGCLPEPDPEAIRMDWVRSPDGLHAILRHDSDLWIRELSSGRERPLTSDGEPSFSYGMSIATLDLAKVARRRAGTPQPLQGVLWSPDGRLILVIRQDLRPFPERLLVAEYVTPDDAYVPIHEGRFPTGEDTTTPDTYLYLIDTIARTIQRLQLSPQAFNDYALHYFLDGLVWWEIERERVLLITANRGGTRYALTAVSLRVGSNQELVVESAAVNVRLNPYDYARPNVHVLTKSAEFLWYSERSGAGHLYLYSSKTGELKRQLTSGDWVVFDLLAVDEELRFVYFTASTRGLGHPYYRYLYRVLLDGGEPQLLTPEPADHKFSNYFGMFRKLAGGERNRQAGSTLSPSLRYFVDSYSTASQPPKYVLRRASGELIVELLSSDASDLYADGWQAPEQVVTIAADGTTKLYGVIVRPCNFDPQKSYPIIDTMYPGPQGSFSPRSFMDSLASVPMHALQAFADAGFIVVAIDARGTAHRSRAFRDKFIGTEDVFGAADHVAAIRNLAADRSYMDLDRVGVRGSSFGGYGALRAMLLHPEFFKVGVCATGPEGWRQFPSGISNERFFGAPADSVSSKTRANVLSNTSLVERLEGRVLLIYGGIDENVPLKHAFMLIDAFIKVGKEIDMLIMPNADHSAPRQPYAVDRAIRYFRQYLASNCDSVCSRA